MVSLIRIVGERKGLRHEDLGDLKESAVQTAVLLIADYCVDHGSAQRGAHQGQLLADRVHDADRIALRRVCGITQQIQVGRREEGIVHALVSAHTAQYFLNAHLTALNRIPAAGGDFRFLEESGDQIVIAVQTDDFFGHVLIAFHVVAVSGDLKSQHALAVLLGDHRLHVQVVHYAYDILIRNCDAQNAADAVDLDAQFAGLYAVSGVDVEMRGGYFAAAELLDQVQGALHGHDGRVLVDALFKAGAGVCSLADASGSAADVVAGKLRSLEHNGFRSVEDLGIQAAHNACQRYRALAVADHEIGTVQSNFLLIQSDDLLVFFGGSDVDAIAVQIRVVKRVHGLSELCQNIVGNINHVRNSVHSHERQTAAHPCGGGRYFDVVDIVADIAGAQLGRINSDVEIVQLDVRLGVVQSGHLEGLFKHSGDLARDAEDALAVGAVSCDGDVEEPVVQAQNGLYVRADLSVIGQDQKSVVASAGIHILADAQLHAGAEHAHGFITAKLTLLDGHNAFDGCALAVGRVNSCADQSCGEFLSCLDVIGAAADLECAVLTAVYGADVQVRVRNGLAGLDQTYYYFGDVLSYFMELFYLEAAGEKLVLQLLGSAVDFYVIF